MEKLAQNNEVMFERNVALIASRRYEVFVYSDSFVYEGFICGLDSKWLQIYGHEESQKDNLQASWRFILLNKNKISGLVPTGRNLWDLNYEGELNNNIEKKIKNFVEVSKKFLTSKESDDVNSRREEVGTSNS